MLTSYQVETVAYVTENGELLCPDCFDRGDDFAKPIIRYSLDEFEERLDGWSANGDDKAHVEECECTWPVSCESCGTDLTEGYTDPECERTETYEPNNPFHLE